MEGMRMKPYHKNPRQIGKGRFDKLTATLSRLGDLGGIVHNLETDEIVGGNQRSRVFGEASKVEIVEQYEQPDEQGTVAHGFIIWKGKRYAYRQVRWDDSTAQEANIAANIGAGSWDWEVIANQWQPADLMEYGFDADLLRDWKRDITAVGMMIDAEKPHADAEPQIDRAEELQKKWKVRTGNLYGIGKITICPKCGKVYDL
jgi:hypothetical protein